MKTINVVRWPEVVGSDRHGAKDRRRRGGTRRDAAIPAVAPSKLGVDTMYASSMAQRRVVAKLMAAIAKQSREEFVSGMEQRLGYVPLSKERRSLLEAWS